MSNKELRELDVWIAEHLFGWKDIRWWPDTMTWQGMDPNFPDRSLMVQLYSSTRWDAMEVLEKCAAKAVDQITITGGKGRGWMVGLANCDLRRESSITSAETLPLAIALFARKLFDV